MKYRFHEAQEKNQFTKENPKEPDILSMKWARNGGLFFNKEKTENHKLEPYISQENNFIL
jgi:hypothetical protein